MTILERLLVPLPQRHDRRHVHLVEGGEHCRGALRFDQPPGDRGAALGHADALFAALAFGTAALLDHRRRRLGLRRRCWRGGRRLGRAAGRLLDVAAHHAAGVAAAAHVREVDGVLLGRLARGRCRTRLAVRLGLGCRRRRGVASRRLGGAAVPRRRLVDAAQHLANLHVVAVLAADAAEDAGLRRADLDVDLVGLELDQRIAGGDDIALLAQPLRHAGIDDGLSDFGNDDVYGHVGFSRSGA